MIACPSELIELSLKSLRIKCQCYAQHIFLTPDIIKNFPDISHHFFLLASSILIICSYFNLVPLGQIIHVGSGTVSLTSHFRYDDEEL